MGSHIVWGFEENLRAVARDLMGAHGTVDTQRAHHWLEAESSQVSSELSSIAALGIPEDYRGTDV